MEKSKRRKWTQEEDDYLIANYSEAPMEELINNLDRTYHAIVGRVSALGLKRSKDYLRSLVTPQMLSAGKKTRFKKGNKSWNKGTKGLTRANSGSFKKRNRPHNWRPIGSHRMTKDGYIEVKYKDEYKSKSNYKLKQRLIWEEVNGKIPKGYLILFRDGNTWNFDIENLELVSKKENILRNILKDQTIAKRFLGISCTESAPVQALIKLKRSELMLNQKIKEYEGIRKEI